MGAREEKIVLDFIGAYRDSWPADLEKACEPLAEDAYYQICVPTMAPVHGRANIVAEQRQMQNTGCEDQKHDMISVGSSGKVVFTVDIRSPDQQKLDAMRARIEAEARVTSLRERSVELTIGALSAASVVASRAVRWIHALPKGDKAESIVQDATELGASAIAFAES